MYIFLYDLSVPILTKKFFGAKLNWKSFYFGWNDFEWDDYENRCKRINALIENDTKYGEVKSEPVANGVLRKSERVI